MTLGQIIILNGPPRSGKSSITAVIQATFPGIWLNLGVDHFMQMTPKQYQPGIGLRPGGERPDLEPLIVQLYHALYESIAAHSRLGLNVVVDVGHHDSYSQPRHILPTCAQRLLGLPVLFVGVRCPLAVLLERRRQTGWHTSETETAVLPHVQRWQTAVHQPGLYDLEVDTSQETADSCAAKIRHHLDAGHPATACQQLATLAGYRRSHNRYADDTD